MWIMITYGMVPGLSLADLTFSVNTFVHVAINLPLMQVLNIHCNTCTDNFNFIPNTTTIVNPIWCTFYV